MKKKKPKKESKNSVVFKFVKRTLSLSSAEIANRLKVSRSEVDGWSRNYHATKLQKDGTKKRLYKKISEYHFKKFMTSLSDDEIKAIRQSGR